MIPLKLVKKYEDNSVFEVRFKTESGKIIGTIERIDGYYCFFTTPREFGSWSEDLLESIAKELRIINKELNDSVEQYFKK
jgi:hypothetical protein